MTIAIVIGVAIAILIIQDRINTRRFRALNKELKETNFALNLLATARDPRTPEETTRLLQFFLARKPLASDVDVYQLAAATKDFNASKIQHVCEGAARVAIRRAMARGHTFKITNDDFTAAIQNIGFRPGA